MPLLAAASLRAKLLPDMRVEQKGDDSRRDAESQRSGTIVTIVIVIATMILRAATDRMIAVMKSVIATAGTTAS